ncbi:hypothetical protein ACWCOP_04250 [Maricaulaceae bacterium MS644]
MEWRAGKSEYTLRDHGALGALLIYDWRLRSVLTDDEMLATIEGPLTKSVLRHLQRLGLVRALHGVRPQGGRMRIWSLEDALRVQAAADLVRATGRKLSVCAAVMVSAREYLDPVFADWERHIDQSGTLREDVVMEGDTPGVLTHPTALKRAVQASVCRFMARSRFDQVSAPAFLL